MYIMFGSFKYLNGDTYNGGWKMDQRNGEGLFNSYNGEHYEGGWKNDKKNGYGEMDFLNGNRYMGEWENGSIRGKGKMIFAKRPKIEKLDKVKTKVNFIRIENSI